nr:reverse transcriptase domain-containing protein [Tanacetum cinerariifolium]
MLPTMRTRSAGRLSVESLRGGTCVRVGRGGRGRRPREGNDERVDDLNGQGNDQGLRANGGIEPIDLGFRYEIKISSRQLVEIDKVIKGCKLEIEGHVFDIYLIPFGHGSFPVIIDDLSGLPLVQEIEFRIELIPGVVSVAKSPYHLAPSELEEFLGQLKELQDKVTSSKCSLWNVILMHPQLMVSRPKIYLREKLQPLQLVK